MELNNYNIHSAIRLWISNRYEAIKIYGEINKWNVVDVTNMKLLFRNKTNFNENINNWNVSNVTEPSSRLAKARRDKSRYLYINIFNDV